MTMCKNCGHDLGYTHEAGGLTCWVKCGNKIPLKECICTKPEPTHVTKNEKLIVEGLCQLTKQNTKDAIDLLTTLKNRPKEAIINAN